jgi:cob(I)alamin adenosyltransferase
MSIYTRRGDAGETGLVDGSRISKASPRVEALGALDEAVAALGLARQAVDDVQLDEILLFAQQRLFNCASALGDPEPGEAPVRPADVEFLERATDLLADVAGGWRGFMLPSGTKASTRLHFARTVVRRAERRLVTLASVNHVQPGILAYVNRLSDLLFSAASAAEIQAGGKPELWDPEADPPVLKAPPCH